MCTERKTIKMVAPIATELKGLQKCSHILEWKEISVATFKVATEVLMCLVLKWLLALGRIWQLIRTQTTVCWSKRLRKVYVISFDFMRTVLGRLHIALGKVMFSQVSVSHSVHKRVGIPCPVSLLGVGISGPRSFPGVGMSVGGWVCPGVGTPQTWTREGWN